MTALTTQIRNIRRVYGTDPQQLTIALQPLIDQYGPDAVADATDSILATDQAARELGAAAGQFMTGLLRPGRR